MIFSSDTSVRRPAGFLALALLAWTALPFQPSLGWADAAEADAAREAPRGQSVTDVSAANPADVESIDAIIAALYEVISGDAGVDRDWDRFRSLFAPNATLNPVVQGRDGSYGLEVFTPEGYVDGFGDSLERDGFHEAEINRVTEQYGMIAHAFSTYESRRASDDPEPFMRGINSIQLLNSAGRWWVVSIYWLGEGPGHPIPERYLGAGS